MPIELPLAREGELIVRANLDSLSLINHRFIKQRSFALYSQSKSSHGLDIDN